MAGCSLGGDGEEHGEDGGVGMNGVKQSKTTSKCLKFDVSLSNHKIKLHNLTAVAVQLI